MFCRGACTCSSIPLARFSNRFHTSSAPSFRRTPPQSPRLSPSEYIKAPPAAFFSSHLSPPRQHHPFTVQSRSFSQSLPHRMSSTSVIEKLKRTHNEVGTKSSDKFPPSHRVDQSNGEHDTTISLEDEHGRIEHEGQQWRKESPYRIPTDEEKRDAKYTGECNCGRIRLFLSRDTPVASKFCHCTDCQSLHGAFVFRFHLVSQLMSSTNFHRRSSPMGCYLPQKRPPLRRRRQRTRVLPL